MQEPTHEVLIVDDEADIGFLTAGILQDSGYKTRTVENSTSALEAMAKRLPSLVLLDIWLEGSTLSGMELLEKFQDIYPSVPIVMISGHGTIESAVSAINLGASDFIEKPFTSDRLMIVVNRSIETIRLRRENEELRTRTREDWNLVGSSNSINQLRQSINKVAPTNSRVLITGPPGSGKTVVGRIIHQKSYRAKGPFITINCATMQPEHFEISLFGSESRSSEGGREIGTFEQAHMGTLFLDEVSDMPLETQGKIVRALQEQTFQRVGGALHINVDVRVIASSSRDLLKLMGEGLFREDLFYRLSVVPIRVPPLNEFLEDIPALVEHFSREMATFSGWNSVLFSEESVAMLQAYNWPGNVRELRNAIERILIMAPSDISGPIQPEMIPAEINGSVQSVSSVNNYRKAVGLPLREARKMFEKEYLLSQVSRFGGNISRTANFVGMERSALHRKMRALGIHSDSRMKNTSNE